MNDGMCERIDDLLQRLHATVRELDAAHMHPAQAMGMVETFAEIERVAAVGRTVCAGRVQQTRAWRATGAATAAAWMAERTGSTLSQAATTLNNAYRLRQLPEVNEAFLNGKLSEVQAAAITDAALVDRGSQPALLALAERESVATLRERCRDVRAAALGDEDVCERIRRGRFLRRWTDRDGALRLDARLAPDDGAQLVMVVMARAEELHAEARRAGQTETNEAYAADALVELGRGASPAKAVVHVHVSAAALERGRTVAGETCRIEGIGPITVAAARRLATDGVVKVLETDGVDVARVAHAGRGVPAHVRTALEARDPTCVVPGCNRRWGLEIDHVIPFAGGGTTTLDNLARLCRWHHAQKTHHGWRLGGGPGRWTWRRGRRGTS